MPGLAAPNRVEHTLYQKYHSLPAGDTFFRRWLVQTPPSDPNFERLGGGKVLSLMLGGPALTSASPGLRAPVPKPGPLNKSAAALPAIDDSSDDWLDEDPLPTSWLQRLANSEICGSGSKGGVRHGDRSMLFFCSECEGSKATHMCDNCDQYFCEYCVKYVHRARGRHGLVGHVFFKLNAYVDQVKLPGRYER